MPKNNLFESKLHQLTNSQQQSEFLQLERNLDLYMQTFLANLEYQT
mgnify:CR=1 FL=1